jgi:hypothetical protein
MLTILLGEKVSKVMPGFLLLKVLSRYGAN